MSGTQEPNPPFMPMKRGDGFGFQPMGPTPLGGGMHDSFNVDAQGNLRNGHTTLEIPGGQKIRMPWEPK